MAAIDEETLKAFFTAAEDEDIETLERLVGAHPDLVKAVNEDGQTALWLSGGWEPKSFCFLLNHGADPLFEHDGTSVMEKAERNPKSLAALIAKGCLNDRLDNIVQHAFTTSWVKGLKAALTAGAKIDPSYLASFNDETEWDEEAAEAFGKLLDAHPDCLSEPSENCSEYFLNIISNPPRGHNSVSKHLVAAQFLARPSFTIFDRNLESRPDKPSKVVKAIVTNYPARPKVYRHFVNAVCQCPGSFSLPTSAVWKLIFAVAQNGDPTEKLDVELCHKLSTIDPSVVNFVFKGFTLATAAVEESLKEEFVELINSLQGTQVAQSSE